MLSGVYAGSIAGYSLILVLPQQCEIHLRAMLNRVCCNIFCFHNVVLSALFFWYGLWVDTPTRHITPTQPPPRAAGQSAQYTSRHKAREDYKRQRGSMEQRGKKPSKGGTTHLPDLLHQHNRHPEQPASQHKRRADTKHGKTASIKGVAWSSVGRSLVKGGRHTYPTY